MGPVVAGGEVSGLLDFTLITGGEGAGGVSEVDLLWVGDGRPTIAGA